MSLSSTERVIYSTRLSKRLFWKPVALAIVLVVAAFFSRSVDAEYGPYVCLGLIVLAALVFIAPFTRYMMSHFVITDQRIIIRHGFLTRTSYEMILEKIESIAVNQSLSDRLIWGSGTLVITGTGGTKEEFPNVGGAVAFQEHLNEVLHAT